MKAIKMMMLGMSLLRNEAETETGSGSADEMFDPLGLGDVSLNDVDTGMPVLVPGNYVVNIKDVSLVENKDKTGNNLLVIFALAGDATSEAAQAKGHENDVKAGFTLRQYMPMQANPDKPDYDFRQNLARLQDAVEGSKKGNRGPFRPSTYIGQQVIANIKSVDDEQYGRQSQIARLSKMQ